MMNDDRESKESAYVRLRMHIKQQCSNYICNMAKEMGVEGKKHGYASINDWALEVNNANEKATEAWCFAIEYVTNQSKIKTGGTFAELLCKKYKDETRLPENTETACGSFDGPSFHVFSSLTVASEDIFRKVRRGWRRTVRGGSKGKLRHIILSQSQSLHGKGRNHRSLSTCFTVKENGKTGVMVCQSYVETIWKGISS